MLSDYEEGSNVTLSCFVKSPLIDIDTITNIQWKYNNFKVLHSYSFNHTDPMYTLNYTISNVELSDAGIYSCLSFIDTTTAHPYIKRSGTSASTTTIIVICECLNSRFVLCYTFVVKSSSIPFIATEPNSIIYNTGSKLTLCCSVILSTSTNSINVNIQWLNSSNHTLHSYTGPNDYTEHTLNYTISNVRLSDAGQYKCSFFVSPSNSMTYIKNSTTKTSITTINVTSKLLISLVNEFKNY